MKKILLIATSIFCLTFAVAQCTTSPNCALSDLNTTSINQSLIPGSTYTKDLGTSTAAWRDLYLNTSIYMTKTGSSVMMYNTGNRFLHNTGSGTGSNGEGLYVGELAGQNAGTTNNSGCVAVGYAALTTLTTGSHNTAIGWRSSYNMSAVNKNTMVGSRSGQRIDNGEKNVGIGHNVFYQGEDTETTAYIDGIGNIGIGAAVDIGTSPAISYGVLGLLTSGNYNSVIGFGSGINITTGNTNLILGDNSATSLDIGVNNNIIGSTTATAITSGSDNIIFGNGSVSTLITGSDNIYIGNGLSALSNSATDDLNIGNAIYGDLTNGYVSIGSSSIGQMFNVGSSTKFQVNTAGKVVASNGQTAATEGNGVPVITKIVDIDDENETIGPTDLVDQAEVTGGFYRISFEGVVLEAASTASSLTIQVVYTDDDAGAMSLPKNFIEDITKTTSNVADASSFTGSFIIDAAASTDIKYRVNYSSTGATQMRYAIRVIVEKL